MTGLAILFSLDTASWPIFVFFKEMDSMLTDRMPGRSPAKEGIRKDNSGKKLVSWQVALFTVYIFFEEEESLLPGAVYRYDGDKLRRIILYCIQKQLPKKQASLSEDSWCCWLFLVSFA